MGSTATADIARMLGSIHDRDRETYEPTVKEPSRAQEKAPADAESPKAADVPRMPEIIPKCDENGQLCLF